ncbi:MAG: type IX secretion system membrane protein PorP/SprF [Bacteroidetes bacterium]|nr:type IX secretion system membrane protein PorP/SprF [Bacteroidota bacterium]
MRKLLIFVLVFSGCQALAQHDPLYSQYMFNPIVINPGYSGSREVLTATVDNRYQWVGMSGAPRTLTLSVHSPLRNESIAVGGYIYSYKLGPSQEFGVVGNYVYRITIGKAKLSLGLQVGLTQLNIDWDKTSVHDVNDPIYLNRPNSKPRPDANFGIYYYTSKFYVGLSSRHLFENIISPVSSDEIVYANLTRHFYLTSGYALEISEDLVFKPSTLIKYAPNAPINVDLNVSFLMKKTFEVGISYRNLVNAIVFMAQLHLAQGLRIGYSYDATLSELKNYTNGSHEIMISYDFRLFKSRELTPRYF